MVRSLSFQTTKRYDFWFKLTIFERKYKSHSIRDFLAYFWGMFQKMVTVKKNQIKITAYSISYFHFLPKLMNCLKSFKNTHAVLSYLTHFNFFLYFFLGERDDPSASSTSKIRISSKKANETARHHCYEPVTWKTPT